MPSTVTTALTVSSARAGNASPYGSALIVGGSAAVSDGTDTTYVDMDKLNAIQPSTGLPGSWRTSFIVTVTGTFAPPSSMVDPRGEIRVTLDALLLVPGFAQVVSWVTGWSYPDPAAPPVGGATYVPPQFVYEGDSVIYPTRGLTYLYVRGTPFPNFLDITGAPKLTRSIAADWTSAGGISLYLDRPDIDSGIVRVYEVSAQITWYDAGRRTVPPLHQRGRIGNLDAPTHFARAQVTQQGQLYARGML